MRNILTHRYSISSLGLLVAVAIFLTAFCNAAFFINVLKVYPLTAENAGFLISVAFISAGFTLVLLSLVCVRHTTKVVLTTVLLLSSIAGYFMDSYNTIIDDSMLRNVVHTDIAESMDLLSMKLVLYVVVLGVLPSILVFQANIKFRSVWREAFSRLKLFGVIATSAVLVMMIFGDFYSSFFREHKSLRYYSNPGSYINAIAQLAGSSLHANAHPMRLVGLDAHIPDTENLPDVLTHAGVNVLWLDNNSDSKDVAERVAY